MRLRTVAATVAISLAGAFGGAGIVAMQAGAAQAGTPPSHASRPTPTGVTSAPFACTSQGVPDTCTLTVTSFKTVHGVVTATGTVTNSAGTISVPVSGVPVHVGDPSCQILELTLGPLHLDLLGLVVDLNQVHLTITAQSGSGNLLGNLLCAVAHLLDNSSPAAGSGLLNQILAAL